MVAISDGQSLRLLSRNGHNRTALFIEPFRPLLKAGLPPMVLDGEIAVPDERGVTHIDGLNDAISARRLERFAYFAFDLLHFDGHDLRRCPIEDGKTLLRDVIGAAGCERVVYVDYAIGIGRELLEAIRQVGAEGIVSKRGCSGYRGGPSRDWVKTKVFETGHFVVTGFSELGEGGLEAVHVSEIRGAELVPAGQVRFGFAGKGLWHTLDRLRDGPAQGGIVPVRHALQAEIKFFGRIGRGFIRDAVLLSISR